VKILLDTQVFLWLTLDSPLLSKKSKKLFLDEENDLFFSMASIWEIAIKTSLGKLTLHQSVENFILEQLAKNSIEILEIDFRHVVRVATLPFHHRDPFDRLLVSQALEEKIPILSSDKIFEKYAVKRLW
jgi:PIN domain nuclease of toxin-antitoxin system